MASQSVFEVLVDGVRCCSLGQIINALVEVGAAQEEYLTVLPCPSSAYIGSSQDKFAPHIHCEDVAAQEYDIVTKNEKTVVVLGAGFSAGLNFPLTDQLLSSALDIVEAGKKDLIARVIRFHFPSFDERKSNTYPNIEELLTKISVNEELWSASRPITGGFKKSDLIAVRQELLHKISLLLHDCLDKIPRAPWLNTFIQFLERSRATVISFNWDLVLERYLFQGAVSHSSYGLGLRSRRGPILLKPHGSLNWFASPGIDTVREDRISSLTTELCLPPEYEEIMLFQRLRNPKTRAGRLYVPYVVPPTFLKRFDHPLLRKVWLTAIQDIGQARKVIFIGYSFPPYDHHSDFMFRCGFNNQLQGNLSREHRRLTKTGPSQIVVVNRDTKRLLGDRMEKLFGFKRQKTGHKVQLVRDTAEAWISAGGLSNKARI